MSLISRFRNSIRRFQDSQLLEIKNLCEGEIKRRLDNDERTNYSKIKS